LEKNGKMSARDSGRVIAVFRVCSGMLAATE
jgi:hypothetical protein